MSNVAFSQETELNQVQFEESDVCFKERTNADNYSLCKMIELSGKQLSYEIPKTMKNGVWKNIFFDKKTIKISVILSETQKQLNLRLKKIRKSTNDFKYYLNKEAANVCKDVDFKEIIGAGGVIEMTYSFPNGRFFTSKKIARCLN